MLIGNDTKETYNLVATINNPFVNHFNCSIYEPFLRAKVILKKVWIVHDGLNSQGSLEIIEDKRVLWSQKIYYCFIIRCNNENMK